MQLAVQRPSVSNIRYLFYFFVTIYIMKILVVLLLLE